VRCAARERRPALRSMAAGSAPFRTRISIAPRAHHRRRCRRGGHIHRHAQRHPSRPDGRHPTYRPPCPDRVHPCAPFPRRQACLIQLDVRPALDARTARPLACARTRRINTPSERCFSHPPPPCYPYPMPSLTAVRITGLRLPLLRLATKSWHRRIAERHVRIRLVRFESIRAEWLRRGPR